MTIKERLKLLSLLLTSTLLVTLTACGGGGGAAPAEAQRVTVSIGLNGPAATTIGAVDLEITLPDGLTLETDSSGQPVATTFASQVSGAAIETNYIAATEAANGAVVVDIIKADGFAGNAPLVELSCLLSAGATLPEPDGFMVTLTAIEIDSVTNSTIEHSNFPVNLALSTEGAP